MKIRGTGPLGVDVVYDEGHVQRHMTVIERLLVLPDVKAVTLHREDGDHHYEVAPDGDE